MDMFEIMQQRHSVRQYVDKAIEEEKRCVLNELVSRINEEADLNVQIFYDEPKCFDSFMAHYGKFDGVNNYVALVGKKSAYLDEKVGYFGEEIVLKAQELGLNTCWVALTHGKTKAKIEKGEKQVCVIALGYGKTQGVPHKSKPISELCNYSENMPDWFVSGISAAALAPTAMNQQKFRFELLPDGKVKLNKGKGFYTALDSGIAKYHFEIACGKRI